MLVADKTELGLFGMMIAVIGKPSEEFLRRASSKHRNHYFKPSSNELVVSISSLVYIFKNNNTVVRIKFNLYIFNLFTESSSVMTQVICIVYKYYFEMLLNIDIVEPGFAQFSMHGFFYAGIKVIR